MAPSTLAIPYAANSPTGLAKLPNAAMKHHSDAASSSQFSEAQVSDPTRTRRSRASRRSDVVGLEHDLLQPLAADAGDLVADRAQDARGPGAPRVSPITSAAHPASRTAPTMATVT